MMLSSLAQLSCKLHIVIPDIDVHVEFLSNVDVDVDVHVAVTYDVT